VRAWIKQAMRAYRIGGGLCQLIWRRLFGRSDIPLTTVHDTLQIVWFSLRQNRVSVGTRVRSGPQGRPRGPLWSAAVNRSGAVATLLQDARPKGVSSRQLIETEARFLTPDESPVGVHGLTPDRALEGDDVGSLMAPCADTPPTGP
jgi:hypothetical protein